MDVIALGYAVKTDQLDAATAKLDKMTDAAQRADKAADQLGGAAVVANKGVAATGKSADHAASQMSKFGGATANVFAQLNDIAVMMASGQNPMQLAMQQGMQLNQVWGSMGGKIGAVGSVLKSAFMSMFNPLNLVTIAVIAFGSAVVNWLMQAGEAAKSFQESIDKIDDVLASANEAANMLSADGLEDLRAKYGQVTSEVLNLTKAAQQLELAKTVAAAREAIAGIKAELGDGVFNTAVGEMSRIFETTDRYAGNLYAKLQNLSNLPIDQQVEVIRSMREQLSGVTNNFTDMTDEQLAMLGYLTTAEDRLRQLDNLSGKLKGSIEGATGSIWNFVAGSDAASSALAGAASWADALSVKATAAAQAIWSALGAAGAAAKQAASVGMGRGSSPGGKLVGGFSQVENSDPYGFRRELVALEKLQEGLKATGKAGGGGGGAGGKISKAMKDAEKATKDADKAAEELRKELEKPMVSAIEGISSAWGDFVSRGFKDFKGFIQSVKDSFVRSIADMAAYAMKNQIMISMGLGVSGGGMVATAAGATGGGGGLMGMLLGGGGGGAGGAGGGLLGGLGGLIGGISGGFSSVVGGLFSGGLGGAGSALSAALGGISGGGLAGLGAAIGALGAVAAGIGAIVSFFKTKKTVLDGGFKLTIGNMEALVQTYKIIEKKKFWGLSKKISTEFETIADTMSKSSQKAMGKMLEAASFDKNNRLKEIIKGYDLGFFAQTQDEFKDYIKKNGSKSGVLSNMLGFEKSIPVIKRQAEKILKPMEKVITDLPNSKSVKDAQEAIEKMRKEDLKNDIEAEKQAAKAMEKIRNSTKPPENPIIAAIYRIQKSVMKSAAAIGVSEKVFAKFRMVLQFSTKDMTEEQIAEEFKKQLTIMGNAFAGMVPGLRSMRIGGEQLMDTLARVAMQFKVVNKTWRVLGFDLYSVSVKGAKAADQIVKIFGNVQNFLQATSFYFDKFYTDQEKIQQLRKQINAGFDAAGIGAKVPKSIKAYRALVDKLESQGRDKAAARLIKLAPLFIQLQDALDGVKGSVVQVKEELRDALDPNDFRSLFEFQRKNALWLNGTLKREPKGPGIYSAPTNKVATSTSPAVSQSNGSNENRVASNSGSENNDAILLQLLQQFRKLVTINTDWNVNGLPPERTA